MQKRRSRRALRVLVLLAMLVPLNPFGQSKADQWRTIAKEGFEGTDFPTGKWITYDASDTSSQGIWSKAPGGFNSANAAHPRGGLTPYNYNTHTWMRWGPFSLAGASNARMLFKYHMNSEVGYDFFSWAYSCNGPNGVEVTEAWTGKMVSGNGPGTTPPDWASENFSLKPCAGRITVFVQFTFHSDQSVNYEGVWVDDVQIQKYAP